MRIARVFLDTHMGKNFKGLMDICRKAGFYPSENNEDYTVFINSKHTKFKLLVGSKYLIYFDNKDKRFPIDAIKYMPMAFSGKEFDFSKAIEKQIRDNFT